MRQQTAHVYQRRERLKSDVKLGVVCYELGKEELADVIASAQFIILAKQFVSSTHERSLLSCHYGGKYIS